MRNDGTDFEKRSADRLSEFGWECSNTPTPGDFGADLICKCGNETLVVQCKDYSAGNSIGVSAVQETITAKLHYGADAALLLFQGRLTQPGQKLAKSVDVKFAHISDLCSGWVLDRTAKGAAIRREEGLSRQAVERQILLELKKKESEYFRSSLAQYKLNIFEFENDTLRTSLIFIVGMGSLFGSFVLPFIGIPILIAMIWFANQERRPPDRPIPPKWMAQSQVREAYKAVGLDYRGAQDSEFMPPSPPSPRISPSPIPSMNTNHRYTTTSSNNKKVDVVIDIWQCQRCQKNLNLKNTIGTFQMKCSHCSAAYIYDRLSYESSPTIIEKW